VRDLLGIYPPNLGHIVESSWNISFLSSRTICSDYEDRSTLIVKYMEKEEPLVDRNVPPTDLI
jgi:hypothetical protein